MEKVRFPGSAENDNGMFFWGLVALKANSRSLQCAHPHSGFRFGRDDKSFELPALLMNKQFISLLYLH